MSETAGLCVQRVFTSRSRDSNALEIGQDGMPTAWSENAKYVFKDKYMHEHEKSATQTFNRLADAWTNWGALKGYFNSSEDATNFKDEIFYMLANQIASPNSPQWFNTGRVGGGSREGWYAADGGDITDNHANIHACYIQSVGDYLHGDGGIYDLLCKEGRLFYEGSGTGTNFSAIRGNGEPIAGGGTSSGLMSFLKVLDAAAGSIKSGGRTRRAAKMVCLDVDHPDIEEFIGWKVREEHKVAALYSGGRNLNSKELPKSYRNKLAATRNWLPKLNLDWQGESYQTVSGQNANNSIRVTDAFMRALRDNRMHKLVKRVSGETREIKASELWGLICHAAWSCADPALQFDDTINSWHTCAPDGRIRASNPCSEYMFLDDTACNLASIRLTSFWNHDKGWDWLGYLHAIRLWTIVLDISIEMSKLPSKVIAERTFRYRTLGLGYCDLGALFMRMGMDYGSDNAYSVTQELTSALTLASYNASMELSQKLGSCEAFSDSRANRECLSEVLYKHKQDAMSLKGHVLEGSDRILEQLCKNLDSGHLVSGMRNAQATAIAPTGTIAILMDCCSTGIEPVFSLVSHKLLAGGGSMNLVVDSIEPSLKYLGYHDYEIEYIKQHVLKTGSVAKCSKYLKEGHVSVFACANDPEENNLDIEYHLDIMAAAQPFVSGAISKTINLPEETGVEEVSKIYWAAWELGLKSVAIYRNNSKLSQPLLAVGGCSSGGCSI